MTYCTKGQQVTVKITAPNNNSIQNFATAPIDINQSGSDSSGNMCWRFQQIRNGNILLEYFGCGKAAKIVLRGTEPGRPGVNQYNLYIDNILQVNTIYYYLQGTDSVGDETISISTVNQVIPVAGSQSIGSCDCLSGGCCNLTITDDNSGNQIFNHIYPVTYDKVSYQVACNGCLPGQIQCTCDNYPGYCCIHCADVENKIDNMTQQVKELATYYG